MSRARNKSKTLRRVSKRSDEAALPPSVPFLAGRKLYGVLCVLLAAATTALYSPVAGHSFVALDDHDYVTSNPHIHGGLSWSTIKWAFTSTEAANWHPLTWLSHALDYQLFALNPAGHHMDSVLIHALNAVLLFLLLAWVTKRVGPSLLVAVLFAAASDQRGIGGVGGGTEERAEHVVLFVGDRSIWVVRAKAGVAALSTGSGVVRRRTDGEADGHHIAVCLVAAGLLAAWKNCRQSGRPRIANAAAD